MKRMVFAFAISAILILPITSCKKDSVINTQEMSFDDTGNFTKLMNDRLDRMKQVKSNSLSGNFFSVFEESNRDLISELNQDKISTLSNLSILKTNDEVLQELVQKNIISAEEFEIFNNLCRDLSYSDNLQNTIDKYAVIFKDKEIYNKYEGLILALSYINKSYPESISVLKRNNYNSNLVKQAGFKNGLVAKSFLSSCAGSSVGLAIAFVGLVAGGTSVVGAGIGAAGFIYASAQWGDACR